MTPYAYITIIFTFLVCGNLNAQQLRKWTNTEGRSFSGTIVDCDGETAKYKVFGRNKLVEIPLSQLCPADRRIAVIEACKLVPSAIFVVSIISSFILLNLAIRTLPLGLSYAIWTGMGAAGAVVAGIFLFNEPSGFWHIFFLSMIVIGIIGINFVTEH